MDENFWGSREEVIDSRYRIPDSIINSCVRRIRNGCLCKFIFS